jgi:phosphatidylglycerol:prolipoprotein diacylglycerol transferase
MFFPHARQFPASEPWVQEFADKSGMTLAPGTPTVNLPRHPTQLYEAFFEGIFLWLILWFILRRRRLLKGFILGAYVIGYGLVRFVLDYFRMPIRDDFVLKLSSVPNPPYLLVTPWSISASQLFSLAMVLGGILFLWLLSRYQSRRLEVEEKAQQSKGSLRKLRKRIQKD